jgi:hypothetical protein
MGKSRRLKKKGGYHGREDVEATFPTTTFTQFRITDDSINSFQRVIASPMDCFINAMQIIGIINNISANLMRISSAGVTGFSKEQIESIFLLVLKRNVEFKSSDNFQEFSSTIYSTLMPNHVCFCGYTGHVFLIGRRANGTIVYIDPQVNQLCNLDDPTCQAYVRDKPRYFILFNSDHVIPDENIRQLGLNV